MDTVRALSVDIGPRPPCSEAERRAAGWCSAKLSALGYDVSTESFTSRPQYALWFAAYFVVALLGALAIVPLPVAGLVLGSVALTLYARDAEGRPLFGPRGGTSHNVVARTGATAPEVVVMAHMDSARSSPSFHPKLVGNFHMSTVALNAALVVVPLTAAAAWLLEMTRDVPTWMWVPAALLAGYLVFAAGLLLYGHFRMPLVPGANDNASGVAVLMRLASSVRDERVWYVVTGSEESGTVGAQAFLAAHADEIGAARFLNIDNVGSGRLLALSGEGVARRRHPDPHLLALAVEAGAEAEDFKGLPTDATPLMARGMRALSILAVNEQGVPPNWHWITDTAENVEPACLDRATEVAQAVLEGVLAGTVRG